MKQTFQVWTVMELTAALVGLSGALLLNLAKPHVTVKSEKIKTVPETLSAAFVTYQRGGASLENDLAK